MLQVVSNQQIELEVMRSNERQGLYEGFGANAKVMSLPPCNLVVVLVLACQTSGDMQHLHGLSVLQSH